MTITINATGRGAQAAGADHLRLARRSRESTAARPHSTTRWITSPSTETAVFPLTTVPTARSLSGCLEHLYDEGFDIDQSHTEMRTSLAPSAFPCRRACSPTAIWRT